MRIPQSTFVIPPEEDPSFRPPPISLQPYPQGVPRPKGKPYFGACSLSVGLPLSPIQNLMVEGLVMQGSERV